MGYRSTDISYDDLQRILPGNNKGAENLPDGSSWEGPTRITRLVFTQYLYQALNVRADS